MKSKLLFLFLFAIAGYSFAQTEYPLVTLQDIQFVPDSLRNTDPPSPYNNDTVRVRGLVLVRPVIDPDTNRRDIISAGARWVTYIQDPDGNLWGGLNILQEDTTATGQATFFDLVDTAQVVEFTGKVTEFNTTTEILLITKPQPIPVQIIDEKPKRPEPIELTLSDLFTPEGTYNFDAEKYEGMYVIFRNVISSDRNANGNFKVNDGSGHFAFAYNQSRFFKTGTAGITPDYQPPLDGSYLSYFRGIVTTRLDGYYIVPVYPGDIGPSITSPPLISNLQREPVLVGPNQDVKIIAKITDIDGTVANAQVNYRVNGVGRSSIAMSKSPIDSTILWEGTIPGVPDSAVVDYFITSSDNQANQSIYPSDTTKGNFFYLVLNRNPKIADVQFSPFGSGFSAYDSYWVTVTGVVTSDTAGLFNRAGNVSNRIMIQDGEGPWSGIWLNALNTATNVYDLKLGDNVTVTGRVAEDFNVTRLDSISVLTVNSSGNNVPEPHVLTTGTILNKANGVVDAEQWESVLLEFDDVSVTDINADGNPGSVNNFGEILINDGSGNVRVELQDGNHFYHNTWDSTLIANPRFIQINDSTKFKMISGYLYFSFSNYKLVPRYNSDFDIVPIIDGINKEVIPAQYSLKQNYPNPFNPSTVISYSIPKEELVTIKIYNVLGQEVALLVNQVKNAGTYSVNFDAGKLSTGVYFYSIKAGGFSQVKKMLMIK